MVANLGGCVLGPLLDSSDKRRSEAARSINDQNVKRATTLKNAFLQYHHDMGFYAQSYMDFERYLQDSRVYEEVTIKRNKDDSFKITFKVTRKDRTYSVVQFLVETQESKAGKDITYERPMRDLVQQRVYALDGHRAGRLNGKKIERKTDKHGDDVIKERNHDGYVE
ncbi:hypothetical protein KS4_32640 [Poriferisphaera corsica]|uniref:Uncharacterized protein n=2 Tax=Poriferisphaera corsica TaxID=2528020 RepID=A0A517YY81_9BACT|nr:hypothetical protein KS4_32640 [Poriferisphaera corsica]